MRLTRKQLKSALPTACHQLAMDCIRDNASGCDWWPRVEPNTWWSWISLPLSLRLVILVTPTVGHWAIVKGDPHAD